MKQHVVHVIGALIAGGAETFVVQLLCALSRHVQCSVLVLSPRHDNKTAEMMQELEASGVHCISGPTPRLGIHTVRWYRSQLEALTPDLVHFHTPNTELVHVLSLARFSRGLAQLRAFRTVHSMKPAMTRLAALAIRMNRTQASIAVGEAVMDTLKQGSYDTPHKQINNGVCFSWLIQGETEKQQARERLGLSSSARIVLSVGRMSAEKPERLPKAQDVLLAAWKKASKGRTDKDESELHLLGDGNLRPKLEAINAPNVHFHGVQSNVPEWLMAADLFVMPSRNEGMPIAGIEALGTGLRCIFSDIPALTKLRCDPLTHFVALGDREELAQALVTEQPFQIARRDQVLKFREQYAIERTAKEYMSLYREL